MARKKKNEGIPPERATNVILESMESDIKKIAEGHSGLVETLEKVDKRLDGMDTRFDILEVAVAENGRAIKGLNATVNQHTEDIKEIKGTVNQINEKLDKVLSDHEERLKKLEVIR